MKNKVEIEFIMKDKLTQGVSAAAAGAERLDDAASAASAAVSQSLAEVKSKAQEAEAEISRLSEQLAKMGEGGNADQLRAEIDALTAALEKERQATEKVEQQHKETEAGAMSLKAQLRAMQEELIRMAEAGLRGTAEYDALAAKAGALSDAIGDVRQQVQHLADDNGNLTAFAQGVNGLAGAFTAGTGVVSLFVGENEELLKIQTKLQSVIAITMGLQQVYNTLNKDSAFRVIAVSKAKAFLTAANQRLAAALGGSTLAAKILMGTLTLGLSVAITAAIVAFERYSSAQEKAAQKVKQRLELEHDARLTAEKARIELNQHIDSLKAFVGTKEEEKKKVQELNDKYGESFGYHKTTKQWLDILIERGQAYAQVLFLQAKMQTLANKAAEAQVRADELKQSKPEQAASALGLGGKAWVGLTGFMGGFFKGSPVLNALKTIDATNIRRHTTAIREASSEVENLQKQMQETMGELSHLNKAFDLGGHSPSKGGAAAAKIDVNALSKEYIAAYKGVQDKLRANDAQLIEDNYVRQRVQAKQTLDRELADIEQQGKQRLALLAKVRKAQHKSVSPQEVAGIEAETAQLLEQARQLYNRTVKEMQREMSESLDKDKQEETAYFRELLGKYQDFATRRKALMSAHERELQTLLMGKNSSNIAEVEAATAEAKKRHKAAMDELLNEEMEATMKTAPLFVQLFGDAANKSRTELLKIRQDTQQLLDYLQHTDSEALEGKFGFTAEQLRQLKSSPEQLKALADGLDRIKEASKKATHPIESLFAAFRKLGKKGNTAAQQREVTKELLQNFTEVSGLLAQGARNLSAVYREIDAQLANSLEGIADTLDGAKNIASGFLSGGWVGAAIATMGELTNIFTSHATTRAGIIKEERRQVQEAIEVERAYQRVLFDTALAYEKNKLLGGDVYGKMRHAAHLAIQKQEELSEAMKGKEGYSSLLQEWEQRLPAIAEKARQRLRDLYQQEAQRYAGKEALANIRIKVGSHKEAAGFLGWGSKMVDDYGSILSKYPKLLDAAGQFNRKYAEAVLAEAQFRDDAAKQQLQHFIELAKQQEEAFEAIDSYLEGIFGNTGTGLSEALVNAFRNGTDAAQEFGRTVDKMLEKFAADMAYNLVFADDIAAASKRIQELGRSSLSEQEKIAQTIRVYGELMQQMGNKEGLHQSLLAQAQKEGEKYGRKLFEREQQGQQAQNGAFLSLSQDQGTKLEGLFTAGQMHWASIDKQLQGMTNDVANVSHHLADIKEDTLHLRLLRPLLDTLERIGREGLKMK